jgi:hypothetical protein
VDRYSRPRGWNDEDDLDAEPRPPRKPQSKAGAALGAAMLGLAEVLQPEKTKIVVEQQNDDPLDDDDVELKFGDLPPLE